MAKLSFFMFKNMLRITFITGMVLFSLSVFAVSINAEIAGPGWHLGTVEPITPWTKKLRTSAEPPLAMLKARDRFRVMALSTSLQIARTAVEASAEIVELARGLQHDPKLIFDYVHNHIDYIPYFGSLKGAHLTLLDKSGNDFDQAALLVALLRESGHTAKFVYGKMTIPGEQLTNWLGVDPGWKGVGRVLPSGGYYSGDITLYFDGTAKFPRIWVKATIDGIECLFDPAYKQYSNVTMLADIEADTGYSRSDLLAAAAAGATIGTDYTQNLNENELIDKLEEYGNNLVTAHQGSIFRQQC